MYNENLIRRCSCASRFSDRYYTCCGTRFDSWDGSRFLTISGLKKNAESKIGNAEAKAREIIDDAVKTAETTKKEALLEVKEESIKTKNDLEKETKERRAELQRYEKECWQKKRQLISVLMC